MLAIEAAGLGKRYGQVTALAGLDLAVRPGEVYGYLGPNGAGKTTTIRLLLGLQRPTSGGARVFGIDAWRDAARAHRRVAYVASEPALWPNLTVIETLELLSRLRGGVDTTYRDELLERFRLEPDRRVRALSRGNRQKVQLVAALATRAELLLLDEPTTGLDPLMQLEFRQCVHEARERGQTVFLSSHVLSEVEAVCDRVGILRDGRLVDEGALNELRHLRARVLEVTFGTESPTLPALPGTRTVRSGPRSLRIEVSGGVGPVLQELAKHPVATLTAREPTLEEIFLHHYDTRHG